LTFEQIIADIRNKIFSPVYFFQGEEPFFIDQLTRFIETHALDDDVKGFNQTIVYGRDVLPKDVIDLARRFPMMGNYQLVMVKEAQAMNNIEQIESYLKAPLNTTILVLAYKYKKFDRRKSFYKLLNKSKDVVIFNSDRLRDYQVPQWIEKSVDLLGYSINPVSASLLSDYLGNDLSKIHNELEKLAINLEPGSVITEEEIETNIGISKDFNVFELQNALVKKDALKTYRIIHYFEANPREHPLQMISVMLHNFFIKVFLYHHIKSAKQGEIAAELGVNPFFVKDYAQASRVYSVPKLKEIISQIRTLDLKSKGLESVDATSYGPLKELVFFVLN
jgi:DNA polymerase-3 subunit delta